MDHGQPVKLFVAFQRNDKLKAKALHQTGQDDDGSEIVAVQAFQHSRQQLRDEAGAGLTHDIDAECACHEVDAVERLIAQRGHAERGQHPVQDAADVGAAKVDHAKQHGADGDQQNIFQFPILRIHFSFPPSGCCSSW